MHCSILTNIHPMLGVDQHFGTPGPPVVPVLMPHFVAQVLGGLNVTADLSHTVLSHNFISLGRGTDIGPGIGHVAANILFPIYILTSASTSEFGAFTVLTENKPTAAALNVYVNVNLNCSQPLNLPTGFVIAPGCNMVGMTLADVLAGVVSIVISMAFSFAMDKLGGALVSRSSSAIRSAVCNIAGRFSVGAGLRSAVYLVSDYGRLMAERYIDSAFGFFLGFPSGYLGGQLGEAIHEQMIPSYNQGEEMN